MMNNDELKKKIINLLEEATGSWYEDEEGLFAEGRTPEEEDNAFKAHVADVLIAAGIGDVEKQHDIFKKAYMDFFTKLNLDKNFRKNFDSITLGCQIGKFEDMIKQAEKELAEERKNV